MRQVRHGKGVEKMVLAVPSREMGVPMLIEASFRFNEQTAKGAAYLGLISGRLRVRP
jgi:hypothetical protein